MHNNYNCLYIPNRGQKVLNSFGDQIASKQAGPGPYGPWIQDFLVLYSACKGNYNYYRLANGVPTLTLMRTNSSSSYSMMISMTPH